jgi:hypothetical protein
MDLHLSSMDLLTNAIESIQVGIEDFQNGARPRLLSAVRNIHSGILLLCKEVLLRECPAGSDDVLLKMNIAPTRNAEGEVVFVGTGKKTVDVQQIQERFAALGIAADWGRLRRVTEVRNDIEHLFPKVDQNGLKGLIADSFILIRDLIANELGDDPLMLLGEDTWQVMLEISEVHDKEKQKCLDLLSKVKWTSAAVEKGVPELLCPSCGSDLLKPDGDGSETVLECVSCGDSQTPEDYAPKAVSSALGNARYHSYKDGGDAPYVSCPECGAEAYVIAEGSCAVCEHEAEHTCQRCFCEIPPEELELEPYCSWCAHMMSKND